MHSLETIVHMNTPAEVEKSRTLAMAFNAAKKPVKKRKSVRY